MCKIFEQHGIQKEARILDYSCGIGRHSIELAVRNYEVVGYDPSVYYIRYANALCKNHRNRNALNVEFICGHPLRISAYISTRMKFDVAILMGCMGFLNDQFDILILKNVARMLKKGAILILELENRDWTIRNFQSYTHNQFYDMEIFERWEFDPQTSVAKSLSKFYKKANGGLDLLLDLRTHIRLYSLHEIVNMLERAGLSFLDSFDNIFDLKPLQHQSQDMVIVAGK